MPEFNDENRLFLYLTGAFVIAFIVLILSHELSHFIASESYGYAPRLSYDHTNFGFPKDTSSFGLSQYDVPHYREVLILAAGPACTITIGIIGLILLLIFRKHDRRNELLSTSEWIFVLLASFWLRPIVNFIIWLFHARLFYKISLRSDEMKIAELQGWPIWTLFVVSAIVAVFMFTLLILKFIPSQQRQTYLLAMVMGSIIGDILWIQWLGPIVLP